MSFLKNHHILATGLTGLLLVLLVLAGCSSAAPATTAPVTTTPPVTTAPKTTTPPVTTPPVVTTTAPAKAVELDVSAAASLTDVLKELDDTYTQAHPTVKVVANFGASGTLQTQIEQGAPADIFISAAAKQMDNLEKENLLLAGTRQNLLTNTLVLIVPEDGNLRITSFNDLALDKVKKVAVGDPKFVPAGTYAGQALDELGITAQVQPKEILGSDVRQVLTYVETGNVDAGIVYLTDALSASGKVIIAAYAPADISAKIIYPAAVLSASKNPDVAKDYVHFLINSQDVFKKYGFTMAY
jgi:molybdate transport system substrate-binding protein